MQVKRSVLDQIIRVVTSYKTPQKIILFGSRAEGLAKNVSDIDIAIVAGDWTDRDYNIVKNRLEEEIKTPLKFDVIDLNNVTKESLRNNILKKGRVIYES